MPNQPNHSSSVYSEPSENMSVSDISLSSHWTLPHYEDVENGDYQIPRPEPGPDIHKAQPTDSSPPHDFVYGGARPAPDTRPKNIVLFGETGVGKSSVINLIAGMEVAETSPNAKACTMQSVEHSFTVDGMQLHIYDTVGLEEPEIGINGFFGAIEKAHHLLESLNAAGGVDLLCFCVRAGRITLAVQRSYRLFFEFLCDKKVPLALVVTHLEHYDNMEGWWTDNEKTFDEYGIRPVAHACVTALPPRWKEYADQRAYSQHVLRTMLYKMLSPDRPPYVEETHNWFIKLLLRLRLFLKARQSLNSRRKELSRNLEKRCSFRREDAQRLAELLVKTESS